jgi:guanylate kinase
MSPPGTGNVVVISGPSGAGKTTVLHRVFETCDRPLAYSVSATTRPPRPGETDGVDYHFLSPQEFHRRREAGDFIECFEVFGRGSWYGTLAAEVATGLERGKWVVLDVDVQGARAVVERFPQAVTIFLDPGSIEELERRLRARRTETPEEVQRRLAAARRELEAVGWYRYHVVNDSPDRAAREICQILSQVGE